MLRGFPPINPVLPLLLLLLLPRGTLPWPVRGRPAALTSTMTQAMATKASTHATLRAKEFAMCLFNTRMCMLIAIAIARYM
jgi:hypothetical protein